MLVSDITIGDRVRKDMGDLQGLAESMKRHGLLHPVVVKKDGTLVVGHRRIEAAKLLGWSEIAVTVIDIEDLLCAERDENEARKDFTPTEAVAIGALIEEQHRAKIAAQRGDMARQNVSQRRDRSTSGLKREVVSVAPLGATDDVASVAVGMGKSKYAKARAVVVAAEAEPEKYGDLPALMDETGNVSGTHREMKRRESNGATGRHPVHRKSRHRDQTKEMERAVWQLEAAAGVIVSIDPSAVEMERKTEWIKSLAAVRSKLGQVVKKLRGGHDETGD